VLRKELKILRKGATGNIAQRFKENKSKALFYQKTGDIVNQKIIRGCVSCVQGRFNESLNILRNMNISRHNTQVA
jgi:hypothetical protein